MINIIPKTNDKILECIETNVKWYNPAKGYGFLVRDNDPTDIMIHFSALDAVSCPYVTEGDRVICDIGPGKRGLQVVRVREVRFCSSEPRTLKAFLHSKSTSFDSASLEELEGTVKWYNSKKGYGFVYPDDGRREVFLHAAVLHAAGYKSLMPGVRVLIKVSSSERGQEARMLTVLFDEEQEAI